MKYILFSLLTCLTVLGQRTPFSVNGVVVANANLTNTATITWTLNGSDISGAGASGGTVGTIVNASPGSAVTGGIFTSPNATGTNGSPQSVTITSGTNLLAGTLLATNNLTVGNNASVVGTLSVTSQITNAALSASTVVYASAANVLSSIAPGNSGDVLTSAGAGVAPSFSAPSGNFSGPASSTNNNLVSFNGTTGKIGKDSGIKTDGSGGITTAGFYQAGEGAPSGGFIRFGTNSPSGYLMRSGSQSGSTTNLGFNWTAIASYFDSGLPPDEVSMWGYNISPGGALANTNDSALALALEGSFNSGASYAEAHLHFIDITNVQHRPFSWRINKSNFGDVTLSHWVYQWSLTDSASGSNPAFFQISPAQMSWISSNANVAARSLKFVDDGFNVTIQRAPGTANQGDLQMDTDDGWRNLNFPGTQLASGGVALKSTGRVGWSSTTDPSGSLDTKLLRSAAGVVQVVDGANAKSSFDAKTITTTNLTAYAGIASTAIDTAVTISPTGWTNTFGKNAVVYIDGVGLTFTVYDNAGTSVYTNSVSLAGASVVLQTSGKVIITAGTLGVGRATPF